MNKIFELWCGIFCILSVYAVTVKSLASNKYYIPRSQTPNFSTLEDYSGQKLYRRWDLYNGPIILEQEVTNAVMLTWTKYKTVVKLKKYVTKAVDQTWQFPDAVITIENSTAGAVRQVWRLGKKWYRYEKDVTGAVKSNGNASSDDLAKYEREIDSWCRANPRFFPPKYCVIYRRY